MTDNNNPNVLQVSITTTNSIHSNATMPPCSTESRLVDDEVGHRVPAVAAAEATGIPLDARNNNQGVLPGYATTHLAAAEILPTPATVPDGNENAVLMTTIGLGIDPFFGSSTTWITANATLAAMKAVRDAMERTILRFPSDNSNLRLHIQLGVPPRLPQLTEPMHVDVSQITPLLPCFVPRLPIEVVVGGLLAGSTASASPHMPVQPGSHNLTCTVVACISLRKIPAPEAVRQPDGGTTAPLTHRDASVHLPVEPKATPERVKTNVDNRSQPVHICAASMEAAEVLSGSLSQTRTASNSPGPGRKNNIDVLAHIGAELHQGEPTMAQHRRTNSQSDDAAGNYNYKKLPPGMTNKQNQRLFVKHSYRDYSHDLPLPDELDLMDSVNKNNTRTVNAAFPLKLHETLSLIEKDGNDHIIGWLPHGRSFKIHQQKEFVEMVLPTYFVMTKKSSFLRQLNLYGFNRLSGTGSDQGSYYHEKFLRGMKFLCRRIHRQKVNGNGIRAAGNPEGEPNLRLFPSCPLKQSDRRLFIEPARANQSLSSSSPALAIGSLTAPAASTSFHLANKSQKDFLCSTESDRIHEDQSSGGDSGFSDAAKSSQPAASFISASFPLKLHCILDKLESEGSDDIISWLPHGRAFLVSNVDRFVEELMTKCFNQSRYASFQRQLAMYNFQRITAGRDKGAYHHPCFLRGCSDLCSSMTRTRVNGKGTRRPGNPEGEPDFYEMDAIPPIAPGTVVEFPTDASSLEPTNNQAAKKRGRVSSCGSESS